MSKAIQCGDNHKNSPDHKWAIACTDKSRTKHKGMYTFGTRAVATLNAMHRSRFDDCAWTLYRRTSDGPWEDIKRIDFYGAIRLGAW